jgi:hypothetical protein
MPSITYLSKNWTVERAIGYARGIVNQIAPDKLKRLQLIDYLNMAQCKLAIMLNGAKRPDYGKTLTIKNTAAIADEVELVVDGADVTLATADLSADVLTTKLRIDTISKIRYVPATGSTKLAIEMNPIEFEGLKDNLPNNKEEVYWCLLGETLYIRNRITGIALEADWGSLLVFYNRYPVKLSVASADRLGDTLDLKDGYVRMLLDIMEIYIRAELDMKPSETNTQNLNALMNQMRESSIAGTAATQDSTNIS